MSTDPTVKDRERATWTQAAPGWRKHDARLRAMGGPVTERMLAAAAIGPGQRVLDIACGTGEPAIPAAEKVGPSGSVLATDFVEEMLAFAREKAAQRGLGNIEFRRVDGEELDVPPGSFDAALIRWGLMFMPDPLGCLTRARAALRDGGRIAVACWAGPDRNPWANVSLAAIKRRMEVPVLPPGAPGLFAFADPTRLRSILESAGFTEVQVEEVHVKNGPFESGAEFFTYTRELSGPIARLFGQLPEDVQQQVAEEIAGEAEKHRVDGKVRLAGVSWVAQGRK